MQSISQGINRVDSWAQFVNLVQDARTRNQAVTTAKSISAAGQVQGTRRIINKAVAAAPQRTFYASPVARATAMETARPATKTLGSFFDAYA